MPSSSVKHNTLFVISSISKGINSKSSALFQISPKYREEKKIINNTHSFDQLNLKSRNKCSIQLSSSLSTYQSTQAQFLAQYPHFSFPHRHMPVVSDNGSTSWIFSALCGRSEYSVQLLAPAPVLGWELSLSLFLNLKENKQTKSLGTSHRLPMHSHQMEGKSPKLKSPQFFFLIHLFIWKTAWQISEEREKQRLSNSPNKQVWSGQSQGLGICLPHGGAQILGPSSVTFSDISRMLDWKPNSWKSNGNFNTYKFISVRNAK